MDLGLDSVHTSVNETPPYCIKIKFSSSTWLINMTHINNLDFELDENLINSEDFDQGATSWLYCWGNNIVHIKLQSFWIRAQSRKMHKITNLTLPGRKFLFTVLSIRNHPRKSFAYPSFADHLLKVMLIFRTLILICVEQRWFFSEFIRIWPFISRSKNRRLEFHPTKMFSVFIYRGFRVWVGVFNIR